MDTSCEKVILGLFVLDRIITSDLEKTELNATENTDLSLGGPPTFMMFISDILSQILPVMEQPVLYSYVSKQTKDFLCKLLRYNQRKTQLVPHPKSPKFILDYSQSTTERKLKLFDPPEEFNYDSFTWQFEKPPILIISSVYQEFNSSETFFFLRNKGSFLAFDPQGCFRKISSEGKIKYSEWFSHDILSQLDCIKLSQSEALLLGFGSDLIEIIRKLLDIAPRYVIITRGGEGALLGVRKNSIKKEEIFSVPAYPVDKVIKETGAGDVFLYVFISFLQLLGDELEAIAYATSLASLMVEYGLEIEKYSLYTIKYRQKMIHLKIRNIIPD